MEHLTSDLPVISECGILILSYLMSQKLSSSTCQVDTISQTTIPLLH